MAVKLPGTLVVTFGSGCQSLIWRVGSRRYLADSDGELFGRIQGDDPPEAADLPVIDDRRAAVGGAVDRDAPRRTGPGRRHAAGIARPGRPGQRGDRAAGPGHRRERLRRCGPTRQGWIAIFGFYTPSLRTPDLIPGQVRLLRSLLIGREPLIERVILASETDGTYVPKRTPKPSDSPSPSL